MRPAVRVLAFALLGILQCASPEAQTLPDDVSSLPWAFDGGVVWTTQRVGNTLFVGGTFKAMARRSHVIGPFGVFDATAAQLMAADPALSGSWTRALVSDGSGGWFLGGRFLVDGEVRSLVHLDGAGRRVAWAPDVAGGELLVNALARVGTRLFVGGSFSSVHGVARDGFAAIDIPSQQVLPRFSPAPRGGVRAIHVSGGHLFIGGASELTKIDLAAGTAAPNWPAVISVNAIATIGSRVFIGTSARDTLLAFDTATAAMTPFGPAVSNVRNGPAGERGVLAIATVGDTLYLGGTFGEVGGEPRLGAAAVNASTGALGPWAPLTSRGDVLAIAASGGDVYLGGDLAPPANGFAVKVNGTTGAESATWRPRLGNTVNALAVDGAGVAVGGFFSLYQAVARRSLAAFDLDTGQPVPMPYTDGIVRVMTVANRILYFGGTFYEVNGQRRRHLAAFDLDTRTLTSFDAQLAFRTSDPDFPLSVLGLTVAGQDLFIGGYFYVVGGQPRTGVAAVDARTGAVRQFASSLSGPDPSAMVFNSFALAGGRLWVAGPFNTVNGVPRADLVALDPLTGAVDLLVPQPQLSGVQDIVAVSGGSLSVAGRSLAVSGVSHPGLALVNASTGAVEPWRGPVLNSFYAASATDDGLVFISRGDAPPAVPALAGFDLAAGTALPWSVNPSPTAFLLVPRADPGGVLVSTLTLGGAGAGWPVAYYARRPAATAPVALADLGVHLQGNLLTVRWTPSATGALPTSYRVVVGSQPGALDVADVPFPRDAMGFSAVAPSATYYLRVVPSANGVDGPAWVRDGPGRMCRATRLGARAPRLGRWVAAAGMGGAIGRERDRVRAPRWRGAIGLLPRARVPACDATRVLYRGRTTRAVSRRRPCRQRLWHQRAIE